ncbi:hypothetical protein FOL47_008608 [Perkinsus chesapeaki]|uniref:MYND-type domain-containing protein n=1 Tax=Perkinsus chesapeaki TaxID=330153 RepID=A0A7J6MUH3_PERCH|nr:hypothetical protein FOL47_008608 [Perkinsus chesapeaki]
MEGYTDARERTALVLQWLDRRVESVEYRYEIWSHAKPVLEGFKVASTRPDTIGLLPFKLPGGRGLAWQVEDGHRTVLERVGLDGITTVMGNTSEHRPTSCVCVDPSTDNLIWIDAINRTLYLARDWQSPGSVISFGEGYPIRSPVGADRVGGGIIFPRCCGDGFVYGLWIGENHEEVVRVDVASVVGERVVVYSAQEELQSLVATSYQGQTELFWIRTDLRRHPESSLVQWTAGSACRSLLTVDFAVGNLEVESCRRQAWLCGFSRGMNGMKLWHFDLVSEALLGVYALPDSFRGLPDASTCSLQCSLSRFAAESVKVLLRFPLKETKAKEPWRVVVPSHFVSEDDSEHVGSELRHGLPGNTFSDPTTLLDSEYIQASPFPLQLDKAQQGGCEEAFYCSEECQRLDWRQGHGAECKAGSQGFEELAQKRKSKASEAEKKSSVVPTRSGSRFEAVVKQAQSAARHSNAAGKIPVKPPVAGIDQALLVLRYGLLQRFGSFRAAVEWFEHHYHGKLNLEEFKNTLAMMRPGDIPGRQTVLPPGVAPYELFGAMDSDGFGEVDLVGLMHSYWDVELKGDHRGQKMSSQSVVHEDPRGHGNSSMRRAHRTAAVLAYRNARYDDAIVNAKQALRAHGSEEGDNLVELLLLSRAYAASSQHDLGVGDEDDLDEYDNEGSENSDESASVEEEYSEDGYSDGDASHG